MPKKKVQVWIWSRGEGAPPGDIRVLVFRTIPDRGDFWQPITGHAEPGEDIAAAALREAQEESGIEFAKLPKPIGYAFKFEGRWGPAEEEAFSIEVEGLPEPRLDPREHVEARWVGPEEAFALMKFSSNQDALGLLMLRLGVVL